ncbi:MAG: hypothetical protein ABI683_14000 [Ginsengibacter sp.]
MRSGTNYSESFYDNLARDEDAIEKTAVDFPFSSLAQYLRLYNSRKKGDIGFEKLLKKTVLYFNNPHWLQFQLSQLDNNNGGFMFRQGAHGNISSDGEPGANHFAIVTDEQLSRLPDSVSIGSESVGTEFDSQNPKNITIDQHVNTAGDIDSDTEELQVDTKGEMIPQVIEENEITVLHQHILEDNINNFASVEDHGPIPHTQHLGTDHEDFAEEKIEIETTAGIANDTPEYVTEQQMEAEHQPEQVTENYQSTGETTPEATKIEPTITQPVVENENAIAFEPLHTVDYFASQGIKITEEALTKDKLGTQMKSFTDWLKSMKKLQPASLPVQNSLAEDIIQSAAEVSNIDTEVLTEAMAEVLIKQDKKEKAIEMYNKLSLINPSKSAYFAAKIESIKST